MTLRVIGSGYGRTGIERARSIVPAARYLELELGEGWEGLCAHLGLPCPGAPYPSGNTSVDFRRVTGLDPAGG